MADAPEIRTWPGQDRKPVEHTAKTDAVLKVDVTPVEATVTWTPKDKPAVMDAGEHFVLSDNNRTLTIKSITHDDKGTWTVKAHVEGQTDATETFEIKVNPKSPAREGKEETPGEWDGKFALVAGIAVSVVAGVLILLIGLWGLVVKPEGGWQVTHVPVVLIIVLAWLSTVALLGSVYLALMSVRARARAAVTVKQTVEKGAGLDTVVEKAFEKAPELVNAYGALKESAALGFVAMAFAGGAIGLAITKFPDVTTPSKTLTVRSADKDKSCTVSVAVNGAAITDSIPAGRYDLKLRHSKTANLEFAGSALSASVKAAGSNDLETSVDLSEGAYKATCTPTAADHAPGNKAITVSSG